MNHISPPTSPDRAAGSSSGRRSHSRTFSFRSDRSSESKSSKPKVTDLHEESRDKRRLGEETKANPNRAIAEAQPADRQLDPTTLTNIRDVQWKDSQGNVITDPDVSNPSRHRLERPLDTIRSFEAAIDSGYRKRNPVQRHESADAVTSYSSRRSSFAGGPDFNSRGYGGHRNQHLRQDMYPPGNSPMRPNPYRQTTAPQMGSQAYHDNGVYPQPSYRGSYDTVNTGGSSGSPSEPWGNSTDPSSENSSLDRTQYGNGRMDYNDAYGSPYGMPMKDAIQEEYGYDGHDFPPGQQYQPPVQASYQNGSINAIGARQEGPPPPPPKHLGSQQVPYRPQQQPPRSFQQQQKQTPRNPIPLGQAAAPVHREPGSGPAPPPSGGSRLSKQKSPSQRDSTGDKPKGWLKKRFSRS